MFRSLFSRLLLSASLSVLLLFTGFWYWFNISQQHNQHLVQQSLHKELAAHMAHINPLLSQGITADTALKEAFHDFILLGPSFEVYTLNPLGKVIAYDAKDEKIKHHSVNIDKIQAFLQGAPLPILGTDPRSSTQKIFSASRLSDSQGRHTGYLYVIVGGEDYDSWQTLIGTQAQLKYWGIILGAWALFSLILFALLLRYFTHPINRLSNDLQRLTSQPQPQELKLAQGYSGSEELLMLRQQVNALLTEVATHQRQVQQQQQAKQDFLLHLSHDLKTPLTSLLGYIETWLVTPTPQREECFIQYALKAGQTLQQLLTQMLELATLENGQIAAKVDRVLLDELLQEVALTFTDKAKQQDVELQITPTPPVMVNTNPQLMLRVLSNLLDNALRHTPAGGRIKLFTRQQPNDLELIIQDTGTGMHEHELMALKKLAMTDRIKTQASLSYAKGQTLPQLGLGLAIVCQLLSRLRCQIDINSQPGKGTVFTITLPLALREATSTSRDEDKKIAGAC